MLWRPLEYTLLHIIKMEKDLNLEKHIVCVQDKNPGLQDERQSAMASP